MNELKEGQRFNDFDEFAAAVNAYGLATNAVFTTLDSRKTGPHQYLKLACKHYGNPRSKSKGIRPLQKTFKQNCPVFVYAKRMEGCVSITRLVLKHENHKCDPVTVVHYPERRQLDKYEKQVVENLVSNNIGPSAIRNKVRRLTGKHINAQDMVNLRFKLQEESTTEVEEAIAVLVELLQLDEDAVVILGMRSLEDATLNVRLVDLRSRLEDSSSEEPQSDNILMFIFMQLGTMRRTFSKYPEVLLMSNTHDITDKCIPLNICMALDGNGNGSVISYMFVGNEVESITATVLNCLQLANPGTTERVTTVVIDKDPSERSAVMDILGDDVLVEVYSDYALQSLKESIRFFEDEAVKEATSKLLQSIVYADTEEDYFLFRGKLQDVVPEDYFQYFLYNWDYVHETWVFYEKFYVPINASSAESERKELIKVFDGNSTLAESISSILLCHQDKDSLAFETYDSIGKLNCSAGHSDPDLASILSICTPFAAKLMLAEILAMEGVTACSTTKGISCECTFNRSLHLPCRHIFFEIKMIGESKFRVEDIPDRWLKASQDDRKPAVSIETASTSNSISSPNPMSQDDAYDEAMGVCEKICRTLSRRDFKEFKAGLQTLKEIRDLWLAGREVVLAEVCMALTEPGPLGINCDCGELVARRTVTRGRRKGEQFFTCSRKENKCSFVKAIPETSKQNASGSERELAQKICSDLQLPRAFKVRGKPNLSHRSNPQI